VLSGLEAPERSKPWELQPGNVLVEKDGTTYKNDACKRRTRKVEADGSVTRYSWDCRDRLRSVVLPDGRLVEFTYDAFARRVRKVVTDAPKLPLAEALREALKHGAAEQRVVTTRFLWDGDVLCAELGDERTRVHVHEPGSFVPLLQAEGGAVYSVVTDHLGMPKELLDAHGRVAWAAAHSAWGRVVEVQRDEGAAQVESPFRLLGQYHDEETGLAYTRFRYFDPAAGRWCSPDPMGFVGGHNLAAFCGSPVEVVDPLGLTCDPAHKAAQLLNDHNGSVRGAISDLNTQGLTPRQATDVLTEMFRQSGRDVGGEQAVGPNIVLLSRRIGPSQPVIVIDEHGQSRFGTADIVPDFTDLKQPIKAENVEVPD